MLSMIVKNVGPDKIEIGYQISGNKDASSRILIMGGGAQMIARPYGYCNELVSRGLLLIRFDNHNTGLA